MQGFEVFLGAALIAWPALKMKDEIQTARNLKKTFSDGKSSRIIGEYEKALAEIEEAKRQIAEEMATSTDKRRVKKLTAKLDKLTSNHEAIDRARQQFVELLTDYRQHAGEIPSAEMQEHLRSYMNNKNRIL
ncbi:hypothetical protein PF586_06860 [Lactobacillus delbrueckii]|uniref:Uncharacterized protein n=1 Tax=Lactobacillus delbrueckii TaxID=1584 RepID=A0AAW5YZN8_9LACO|nr:hypothetical protein [Lactobacillus delbrueckii]MDA3768177.1 hypothetical protein [Lactobacillus delbrueckii]